MAVSLSLLAGAGWQFLDDNANPLTGGLLYTYAAGTTTPLATYTSSSGATPNANPIVLDAAGRVPQEVWLSTTSDYKFILKNSTGVTIWTKDDIPGGLSSDAVTFLQAGTGAVERTAQSKMRDVVSVFDFMTAAQVADVRAGTALVDVSVPIQAALNTMKSSSGTNVDNSQSLYFPAGVYLIGTSLSVTSGQWLFGEGPGTILKAAGGLTTQIISLDPNVNNFCLEFGIEDMAFESLGTAWAIKAAAQSVGNNAVIQNLTFNCQYCVSLATYSQSVVVRNLYARGNILNQLLYFKGNRNFIGFLNKEQGTGTSVDPYVLIENHTASTSDGNYITDVLLEGTTSVNKTPLKLVGVANTIVENIWCETTQTDGYHVRIDGCRDLFFRGYLYSLEDTKGRIKIDNSTRISFEDINADGLDITYQSAFDIDSSSVVFFGSAKTRRGTDLFPIASISNRRPPQFAFNRQIYSDRAGAALGYSPVNQVSYVGGNMLVNPSFEAGAYGWTDGSGSASVAVATSEVAPGLMATYTWGAPTVGQIYQSATISAGQVGKPVTFTALVKANSGTGFAAAYVSGVGITDSTGYQRVSIGSSWHIMTLTVVPQAAGTLNIGVYAVNLTSISIDEASLSFGIVAQPNLGKFGSAELNGKTFTTGTAAPVVGTWKVGDRVFNSAPAVGAPKSWVCTVAGTPGTWVSEGNL